MLPRTFRWNGQPRRSNAPSADRLMIACIRPCPLLLAGMAGNLRDRECTLGFSIAADGSGRRCFIGTPDCTAGQS